jgi:hypothetical protein
MRSKIKNCFIALAEEILLQPTGHKIHNENQDFNILKITNQTFKTDIR